MNPILWKAGGAILLILAAAGIYHHVFEQGVAQERTRRDKIDADNTIKAQAELAALNSKIHGLQAELNAAAAKVAQYDKELNDEKVSNAILQSAVADGRVRYNVLIRQSNSTAHGKAPGTTTGRLDSQPAVEAELDTAVAASLVGIAGEGDQAITRLNACIVRYDALKAAVDALP